MRRLEEEVAVSIDGLAIEEAKEGKVECFAFGVPKRRKREKKGSE